MIEKGIFVTYGFRTGEQLAEVGAETIINHPKQVLDVIFE